MHWSLHLPDLNSLINSWMHRVIVERTRDAWSARRSPILYWGILMNLLRSGPQRKGAAGMKVEPERHRQPARIAPIRREIPTGSAGMTYQILQAANEAWGQ
jgi:hypothetical protein